MTSGMFTSYIVVDWSAASSPKKGKDSIWYSHLSRKENEIQEHCVRNPTTRKRAVTELENLLLSLSSDIILVGWDFSFGFPRGFHDSLKLDSTKGGKWASVWKELASLIEDNEKNRNNRFQVAAMLNKTVVFVFFS